MTVKDLRKLLSKYPDDYLVVVPGYEGGYDSPILKKCGEIKIVKDQNRKDWDGEYDFSVGEPGTIKALFLPRNSN